MLRISSTVAIPSSRMMSRPIGPAMPSDTVSPKLFSAHTIGGTSSPPSQSLRAHLLGDAGEQVVLGRGAVHEGAHQLVVLGGPDLPLDVQRRLEPEPVRVDRGGVGPQGVVAGLEPLAA